MLSYNLVIPLVSPQLLSSSFTSDFRFYDYHTIPVHILLYHLWSIPPVSCYYHLISYMFPPWYQLMSLYLILHAGTHDTVFNAYLWLGFIDTHVLISARHLAFASPLAGEFWLLWILMSRFLELGACGFSQLLIRVAQLKRGSPADRPEPHPFKPPTRL